jgi:uncharacterized phage protein gp47/JayE
MPQLDTFTPIFTETAETVRSRMLADMPESLSKEEGSFTRDMLEIAVLEALRRWDAINRFASYTFPSFAFGDLLDYHAASYGLTRSIGTLASGSVRFSGPQGTVIPPGTIVEVPSQDPDEERIRYTSQNAASSVIDATGSVDILCVALSTGAHFNQAIGAVTRLDSPVAGVTAVTNMTAMTGGSDAEDDFALKARVLAEAALPVGSGTVQDYVVWGREVPGLYDITVYPLWDTAGDTPPWTPGTGNPNGTVGVVVRDSDYAPVDWAVLQAAQVYIDPSRQLVALMEAGEPWLSVSGGVVTSSTANKQHGNGSIEIQNTAAQTTIASLVRAMNLARFDATDNVYFYAYTAGNWANVSNASYIEFRVDGSNYFRIPFSASTTAQPGSGSGWWRFSAAKSSATATGNPTWDAITEVRIALTSTATVTVDFDYFSIRSAAGAAGKGRAPIGASVTLITPVQKLINVTASLTLATGFTLTGANGTTNVTDVIRTNIVNFLRTLSPGATVRVVDIANVIHDTPGVVDYTLTAPAANTAISVLEYATLGTLTLS